MKRMKKLASLVLALAMVFAMTITVAAARDGSITMNGTVAGKSYELYKIFDLTYTGTTDVKVAYTIDPDWADFFGTDGAGYIVDTDSTGSLNPIIVGDKTRYINITDSNVEAFSQAALSYAVTATADKTVTAAGTTTEVTGLDLGYYLMYPVGAADKLENRGCLCSLTSTTPNGTVDIKATYPTITKTDDKVSADVGEAVNYTITGKVPDTTGYTAYTYTIKDTMSAGLTFDQEDVTVKILEADSNGDKLLVKDTDYTYTQTDNGFELTIKVTDLQAYVEKAIQVTYAATVNDQAVTKIEKNSATLTYSNNPADDTKTETTAEVEENVYSSKIVIDKYAANDDTNKLSGATFVLYKYDTDNTTKLYYKYTAATETAPAKVEWVTDASDGTSKTTDDTGAASFDGLADGTYYLEETEAPEGYNKLDEDVAVTVDGSEATSTNATSLTVTKEIENKTGSMLPSTGGIGTKIFYVAGGILVVAAAVLLITRKRMSIEK